MPHLRFRALKNSDVQALSQSLAAELATIMNTTPDNFTFESIASQFYSEGQLTPSYPFVEVLWFARSPEVQTQSARLITQKIQASGEYPDVVVIFIALPKSDYYENGEHF